MILCRKRKFIILGIPKTGSTSIMHHLLKEIPDEIDVCSGRLSTHKKEIDGFETIFANAPKIHPVLGAHPTLKDFVYHKYISEKELQHMNVYAFMREPVDRFISIAHFLSARENRSNKSNFSNDEVVENCVKRFGKFPFLAPQSNWILHNKKQINRLFIYPNFSKMFEEIGVPDNLPFQDLSGFRPDKSINLSQELVDVVRDIYRIDVRLWDNLLETSGE